MKLKFNHDGQAHDIPLSTDKPQGKRFAIRHNGLTYYAPLVPADNPNASAIKVNFGGTAYALATTSAPQITDLTITPPTLAAMQGQSATATITAMTNEQVAGLSYSLDNPPTWITISDDVILIDPSDNDLGQAVVQVYARDTGSDASASAPFVAEALLRPIIESLTVIPPAVTVQQGLSATAGISAVANAAVTGLSFSLNGASSWVNLNGDVIQMAPTDNDLGDNTVNVVAYDVNSSASATTQFVASAALRPIINAVTANPADVTVNQGQSATVTLSADANAAVTGLSYSLADAPSWMTLGNDVITIAPTDNDLGSVTVTATARDTNSSASASTTFTATAEEQNLLVVSSSITSPTSQPTLSSCYAGTLELTPRMTLRTAEGQYVTNLTPDECTVMVDDSYLAGGWNSTKRRVNIFPNGNPSTATTSYVTLMPACTYQNTAYTDTIVSSVKYIPSIDCCVTTAAGSVNATINTTTSRITTVATRNFTNLYGRVPVSITSRAEALTNLDGVGATLYGSAADNTRKIYFMLAGGTVYGQTYLTNAATVKVSVPFANFYSSTGYALFIGNTKTRETAFTIPIRQG